MPRVSPKTPKDRLEALPVAPDTELKIAPDLMGHLGLEPTNFFTNWRLDVLKDDNDPEGLSVGMPEDYDGFSVLMSERNRGTGTMTEQNTAPIDPDDDSYVVDEPWSPGDPPRSGTNAAEVAPPEGWSYKIISADNNGLPAGDYGVTFSWFRGDMTTNVAPLYTVTGVLAGQFLRVTLPTDPPEGATHLGIWLTRPNKGFSTIRLQAKIPIRHVRPTTWLIKRYRSRGKHQDRNETRLNAPRKPKLRKVPGRRRATPGTFTARIAAVDVETQHESELSVPSDPVTLTQAEANAGFNLEVEPTELGDPSFQYAVYLADESGAVLRLGNGEGSTPASPFRGDERAPRTGARTQRQAAADRLPSRGENTTRPAGFSGSEIEDKTQMDDPTSELEGVAVENKPDIPAGQYWFSVAGIVAEEKTVMARPQRVTVGAGQSVEIILPHSVLVSRNGNFTDIDKNGRPDAWTITGTGGTLGTATMDDLDRLVLDTVVARTGTTASPLLEQTFLVNRDAMYTVVGEFVAAPIQGTIVATVAELNDAGTVLGTTTTLRTMTSSGNYSVDKRFGPDSTGKVQGFQDGTSKLRIRVEFVGATRHGSVAIEEFDVVKHTNPLRRRDRPKSGERRHSNTNPGGGRRYRNGADKGIELPPQKYRRPPMSRPPMDRMNFDDGTQGAWTSVRTSPGDLLSVSRLGVETGAVYVGNPGLRVSKGTTATRYGYIWKAYEPTTRARHAEHFALYVSALPDKGWVTLLQIRPSAANGLPGALAAVILNQFGQLRLVTVNANNSLVFNTIATGVRTGEVWDIELIVSGGNSAKGYATAGAAVMGSPRRYLALKGPYDWTNRGARVAQFGASAYEDKATLFDYGIDDIVVTEFGDPTTEGSSLVGELPLPHRPLRAPAVVYDADFESGIPAEITVVGGVYGTYGIEGSISGVSGGGVRFEETDTLTSTDRYAQYLETTTRTSRGYRARLRIVTRPTTGNAKLGRVVSGTGMTMGWVYIDSSGDIYVQTFKAGGTALSSVRVATGIANGQRLTLELVPEGAGTASGVMSYWLSVDGSGTIGERALVYQDTEVDWTEHLISYARFGLTSHSVNGLTATVDVDKIRVTETGEVFFWELDEEGNPLYQIHAFYPAGTPQRDDLWVQDLWFAVAPGKNYKLAVDHRIANAPPDSHPFYVTAYDLQGNEYPLGSVYGDSGVSGTVEWADVVREYLIPEGCYAVKIHSLNIGGGEYTCQRIFWGRTVATNPSREVYYPASNVFRIVLDTKTPDQELLWSFYPENIWLGLNAPVNAPEGTSASFGWQSSDSDSAPGGSWEPDPTTVPQRRYVHAKVTLNASPDLRNTPQLPSGSPNVEFYTDAYGMHLATLLREDLSEFPGGIYATDVDFPTERSTYDVRETEGRVRRHRRHAPVGRMEDVRLFAVSEEAMDEFLRTYMDGHMVLESDDRRALVKFKDPELTWEKDFSTKRKIKGKWYVYAEMTTGQVEVSSVDWIPGLASAQAMGA